MNSAIKLFLNLILGLFTGGQIIKFANYPSIMPLIGLLPLVFAIYFLNSDEEDKWQTTNTKKKTKTRTKKKIDFWDIYKL